ncbi:PREDICTED: protein TIPIN homolog [Cyphomyrmex costatus]|uniref:TIMELESS-interacting protein n=1 Tax=Cyphomyrmex costatus TaxID=456900 RepID=A0A151IP20_9HYME|nr:PREDICTED: protein TIPIN homolog [Cyphomyrmex costatus]KYN07088.1 Protein TIPIN like protein [Cyphomyrmex costatus]
MADIPDYEGDDDIIEHYENQESDDERGSHGEAEDATSDNEMGTARRIDPSKTKSKSHVVRNPVPKLNTERLTGPNGIQIIEKYFEGFKFYGKGHERMDLDRIMKRLEHWSYRLFPKYHFDDFLTRVEQLGTKKDLQVFIKKYRLDMITSEDDLITRDIEKDDENEQEESVPLDDFDLLITEQIQKQKQAETRASIDAPSTSTEDAFDKLLMQSTGTQNSQVSHTNTTANEMSDELKQKIERNKQLAIERRLQRQKEREEEVKRTKFDDTNVETVSESDNFVIHDETNISQIDSIPSQINGNTNKAIINETILSNDESAKETDKTVCE